MGSVFDVGCGACGGSHLLFVPTDLPAGPPPATVGFLCPVTGHAATADRSAPGMLSSVRPVGSVLAHPADG